MSGEYFIGRTINVSRLFQLNFAAKRDLSKCNELLIKANVICCATESGLASLYAVNVSKLAVHYTVASDAPADKILNATKNPNRARL